MPACHFTVDHTWQFQLRSDRWRSVSSWYRKKQRWSRKRGVTAQMYNSFIHHPSLFASHQSKPTKSLASPFLSREMSSVGACLRHCRREKGHMLCVHFDFFVFCLFSALEMGQFKLSLKVGTCYPQLTPVTMLILAGMEKTTWWMWAIHCNTGMRQILDFHSTSGTVKPGSKVQAKISRCYFTEIRKVKIFRRTSFYSHGPLRELLITDTLFTFKYNARHCSERTTERKC